MRLVTASRRILVAAAAVLAASCALAAALAAQSQRERAERILQSSCQACHDTRRIDVQARTRDEWAATVREMIEKGARVSDEDLPVLLDYLAIQHGPVPAGPGREVLLNTCTMCHDLTRIRLGRRSAEEWEETLVAMLNEGAPLSERDFVLVHHYLSQHFGID